MIIEIHNPELERLLEQRLQTGFFQNIEDVLLHALQSSEHTEKPSDSPDARDLVELFAQSPFAVLNMDFERDQDTGRDLTL